MDRLSPFFEKFPLVARMFYAGRLCGSTGDHDRALVGHLHVLRKGRLTIVQPNARQIVVDTPSIVFGAGMLNPLIASLPEPLVLPLDSLPELAPTLQLLFAEAFAKLPGRRTAIDRLFEYLFVLLIRSAMNTHLVDSGVLIGLSDLRLGKAIEGMHKHPETSWSLEQLAQRAGMSRSRFAAYFRQVVGMTPFDYLTNWRLGVAQTMLRKGKSLKLIASAVGYANATALTRVFTQRVGMPPSEWLARSQGHRK